MEKVQISNKEIIKWCDEQHAQEKELKLLWDGGGDSGWVHFELDGEDVSNEYIDALVDQMYDLLDYGSWAGEFSANGEAVYDPEKKAFVGIDHYGEDDSVDYPVKLEIRVPASIIFDRLEIEIEDEAVSDVTFIVKNGFKEDTEEIENSIKAKLDDDLDLVIEEFSKEYDFRNIWNDESYERSDFVIDEKTGELVLTIKQLQIGMTEATDKNIYLALLEGDESLNEEENEESEQ